MEIRKWAVFGLFVMSLAACGGGGGTPDAANDMRADASPDGASDLGADALPDAMSDAPLDVGMDAVADAVVDTLPDLVVDLPVDVGSDLAVDVGPDLPTTMSVPVFAFDFESALPTEIDPGAAGVLTPTEGFETLGPAGGTFGSTFLRSPSGNAVTVTLTGLPAHASLTFSMLFAAIDSLDGTSAPPDGDFFRIDLDGVTIFRESFANAIETQVQSYDPPPAAVLARRADLGFRLSALHPDSAYDFGADPRFQSFPHAASTAVLTFILESMDPPDLNDESWAIDNLRVAVEVPIGSGP